MVARLLHECGVSLGPEDELYKPAPHNPDGHFENRSVVMLNDEILAQFGGGWDDPPILPTGWEFAPEVGPLLERTEAIIGKFAAVTGVGKTHAPHSPCPSGSG